MYVATTGTRLRACCSVSMVTTGAALNVTTTTAFSKTLRTSSKKWTWRTPSSTLISSYSAYSLSLSELDAILSSAGESSQRGEKTQPLFPHWPVISLNFLWMKIDYRQTFDRLIFWFRNAVCNQAMLKLLFCYFCRRTESKHLCWDEYRAKSVNQKIPCSS